MDQSPPASPATETCPACGAPASGRFCSACGAVLVGATCAACGTQLSRGAKFCHRCGTPAGNAARDERSFSSALPWGVAAIALVALVALFAGQRFGRAASDGAAPQTAATPDRAGGRPPDLSSMTPADAAARLYDRVMSLHERGRADSVRIFAPMAIQAYEMIGNLDLDQRYDVGRIAAVAGDQDVARAQADTILAKHPNHLLGLILAGNAARMRNDVAAERRFHDQLVAAAPTERAKQLSEYATHENDITIALDAKRP